MTLYLDANVIVLATTSDAKGERALGWLDLVQKGIEDAIISSLTFDEVIWVLLKNGKGSMIEEVVRSAYSLKNCVIVGVDAEIPLSALEFMKKFKLKPRDAFHLAIMKQHGVNTMISDDADFDRVRGIKRKF